MSIPRLHLEAPLAEGAVVEATPGQAHHLGTVLRRGPGDAVVLFNARDGAWEGEIATLRKDRASFRLGACQRAPTPEPGPVLLIALLKREPMDWLVEKATELGVSRIIPVITRRTITERSNIDRLRQIARAAAEQCERLSIPAIAEPAPLHRALDAWDTTPLLVAAERGAAPALHELAVKIAGLPALLVGPEGGFDRAELDDALRRPFVGAVALGPRILRAETAAIAGLAAIQARFGDWAHPRA
jgi:16S rRNA (uracil1498-N3)-methyltransferase